MTALHKSMDTADPRIKPSKEAVADAMEQFGVQLEQLAMALQGTDLE